MDFITLPVTDLLTLPATDVSTATDLITRPVMVLTALPVTDQAILAATDWDPPGSHGPVYPASHEPGSCQSRTHYSS